MVLLACFWSGTMVDQVQIENLETTETVYSNKVEYLVENVGSVAVSFDYIVIQDNVLAIKSGQETVEPNESVTITAVCANAPRHSFELDLTER